MSKLKTLVECGSKQQIEEYVDWARSNPQTFIAEVARLLAAPEIELIALSEKLKLQAQIHAQESRTQKATVHEIYQGLGIQKGNWNGAKPVLDKFKEHDSKVKNMLDFAKSHWSDGSTQLTEFKKIAEGNK